MRSIVHLYYGSFVELARRDDGFDFDAELVETLEHEVKHHLEDKAGVRDLEEEDDLFDAHARFLADLDLQTLATLGLSRFADVEPAVG